LGDACDADDDEDRVPDATDNCPVDANFAQTDTMSVIRTTMVTDCSTARTTVRSLRTRARRIWTGMAWATRAIRTMTTMASRMGRTTVR
jgi:hypothetical protein